MFLTPMERDSSDVQAKQNGSPLAVQRVGAHRRAESHHKLRRCEQGSICHLAYSPGECHW